MTEELFNILKSQFESVEIKEGKNYPEFYIPASELTTFCKFLKDDDRFSFDFLFNLTAVDWIEYFNLVYHLESTKNNKCIVVKSKVEGRDNVSIDTVSMLWPAAEFFEREVFDLFGINFNNHPDMRRLFLEENWNGHPLRKDYIDEINIIER